MARVTRRNTRVMPKRKFVWARSAISAVVAAQDHTTFNLFQTFEAEYGAQLLGSTVMRLRGVIRANPAATASVVAAASVVVAADGVPVGDPLGAGRHLDWMAYQPLVLGFGGPQFFDWEIDVKSARKVEELGETLMLVISNPLSATALNVDGAISVGIKLP